MSRNENSVIQFRRSQRKRTAVQEHMPAETPRALLEKVREEKALRNSSPYDFNAEASNIATTTKGKKSPAAKILLKENENSVSNHHTSKTAPINYLLNVTEIKNKPSQKNKFFKGRRTSRNFTFSHKAVSKVQNSSAAKKQKIAEKAIVIESSSDDDIENNSNSKGKNASKRKIESNNNSVLHIERKANVIDTEDVIPMKKVDSQNKKDKSHALKMHSQNENNKSHTLQHYFTSSIEKKRTHKPDSSVLVKTNSIKNTHKKSNGVSNENDHDSCSSIHSSSNNSGNRSRRKKGIDNTTLSKSPSIQPRRHSLRLDEKEKSLSQKVSDQTSPKTRSAVNSFVHLKDLSSVSVTSPLSSASLKKKSEKMSLNKKELKNKRLEELKRAEITPSVCNLNSETYSDSSDYHSRKLHSTALNVDSLPLTFDGSSIEPIMKISTLQGKTGEDELNACPSSNKSGHQKSVKKNHLRHAGENSNQLAIELTEASISTNVKECNDTGVPSSVTCDIVRHFADMPVAKSAVPILTACCEDFWKQTLNVIMEYSDHAGRDSIDVSDVELLLYRLGNIPNRNTMNAMIAKYLPMEIRSKIIPVASAGNVVYPLL